MSEHTYRLLMGTTLLILLYSEVNILSYFIVGLTLFEGITNQRLNLVVTRLRKKFGANVTEMERPNNRNYKFPFDAERAQRLLIAVVFAGLYFYAPKELWMLNWFFAFGILISGIVMFCPVIALFRALGFR